MSLSYCKDSTYQRGPNMTKIALITGANRGL
ncbi:MAG: 3-oxoacyl-ACP reductase, partial [Klebsiella pneumoniae]|nr:3-oxoacyl-ACP reductase [Klebsiella pneumoniae]